MTCASVTMSAGGNRPFRRRPLCSRSRMIGVTFGGLQGLAGSRPCRGTRARSWVFSAPTGPARRRCLNVISGYTAPTTGAILSGRKPINSLPPERRARRGIARTFQAVRLFGALTVRENIEVAALSRLPRACLAAEASRWLDGQVWASDLAERQARRCPTRRSGWWALPARWR